MSGARAALTGLALALLAGAVAPAAGAQQPRDDEQSGGIVSEELKTLTPHGEGAGSRDERFQSAPFRTRDAPMVPELIPPVDTEPKAGARLRQLDKMTGQAETVEVAAGDEILVDRLRVRLEACQAPADNAEHGTKAFLKIWDTQEPIAEPVFSGWMFAESPALSAMDHPRYDLWVMSCITESGEGSSASR